MSAISKARAGLTCRELVELVTDYFEGALSRRERRRFEQHVGKCPWCAAYLEQMRQVVQVLGRLEEESLSPTMRDALLDAFRDWKDGKGMQESGA